MIIQSVLTKYDIVQANVVNDWYNDRMGQIISLLTYLEALNEANLLKNK